MSHAKKMIKLKIHTTTVRLSKKKNTAIRLAAEKTNERVFFEER